MELFLRNNAVGMRKQPRSTSCPSERSERLERFVIFHVSLRPQ